MWTLVVPVLLLGLLIASARQAAATVEKQAADKSTRPA
jgi:hypothetical protein